MNVLLFVFICIGWATLATFVIATLFLAFILDEIRMIRKLVLRTDAKVRLV